MNDGADRVVPFAYDLGRMFARNDNLRDRLSLHIQQSLVAARTAIDANDLALAFCLERLHVFLNEQGNDGKVAHVIFESRGKREDDELELEFRRVCDGQNMTGQSLPFAPVPENP